MALSHDVSQNNSKGGIETQCQRDAALEALQDRYIPKYHQILNLDITKFKVLQYYPLNSSVALTSSLEYQTT